MRIDVWSDIVCPFCHVGRRHLELALADFEHADECQVVWHSYELDRSAPPVAQGPVIEQIARKYGRPREEMEAQHRQMAAAAAAVGLDFQWERLVGSNSYDAHRLIHAARAEGREKPVTDAIMRAWYSEGAAIGDHDVLRRLAVEGGLAPDLVDRVLASDEFGMDVRTDEAVAAQIGITGVPTFVLDQKFAVTGAQPVDVLAQALAHAWDDRANRPEAATGGGCGGGGCGDGSTGDGTDAEGIAEGTHGGGCGCGSAGDGADAACAGGVCEVPGERVPADAGSPHTSAQR